MFMLVVFVEFMEPCLEDFWWLNLKAPKPLLLLIKAAELFSEFGGYCLSPEVYSKAMSSL